MLKKLSSRQYWIEELHKNSPTSCMCVYELEHIQSNSNIPLVLSPWQVVWITGKIEVLTSVMFLCLPYPILNATSRFLMTFMSFHVNQSPCLPILTIDDIQTPNKWSHDSEVWTTMDTTKGNMYLLLTWYTQNVEDLDECVFSSLTFSHLLIAPHTFKQLAFHFYTHCPTFVVGIASLR